MRKSVLWVLVLALLFPAVALAQRVRDQGGRSRDQGGRDQRSDRIERVIRDCEDRTNDFLRAVERAWGGDRRGGDGVDRGDRRGDGVDRGGRRTGDGLDRDAARLERALNRIRESWNRERDYGRTRGNVGAAIDAGRDINRVLRGHRLNSRLAREWDAIKRELNNLAVIFEQPRIRW